MCNDHQKGLTTKCCTKLLVYQTLHWTLHWYLTCTNLSVYGKASLQPCTDCFNAKINENHSPVCYLSVLPPCLSTNATHGMWSHPSHRAIPHHVPLIRNTDAAFADWMCLWSTHGEAVYTGTSRNSCCVLLCICSLTQSVKEPAAFNTGWSFLSRWKTPVPFLLHPHCHASPGCSWCFPVPCHFEAGAGADALHCATRHTQSRSGSLRKVVMRQGEMWKRAYWEQLDSVQR